MNTCRLIQFAPSGLVCLLLMLTGRARAASASTEDLRLPPAATNRVDFAREILPLFERSCFQCHGDERPKSGFSLSSRESALKGGNQGVAIIPGNSAGSSIIHYVSGMVPDSEMPPPGKAPPLTGSEIGLLRAWIDQGAVWDDPAADPAVRLEFAPSLGWTTVKGDERKFRELMWQRNGWNGGLEYFSVAGDPGGRAKLSLEGHALADDYRLEMLVTRPDLGFTRFGWNQYRRYFDDTGGWYPAFAPSAFSLDRDLYLDVGRAWADFGLTLPDWPELVLGYEYQYRDGNRSTLQWGSVTSGGISRNIYPSQERINEDVHILKVDVQHTWAGTRIEDTFRGEFYSLTSERGNVRNYNIGDPAPSRVDMVQEEKTHFQGANAITLEKPFTPWLLGSAGYLYSHLNADAAFSLDTVFPTGTPGFADQWRSHAPVLDRDTHALNAAALLGPWQGFTLSAGLLSEWTREERLTSLSQDLVLPNGVLLPFPAEFAGNLDKALLEESLTVRYTTIPFTILFAEARLQQENTSQFEEQIGGPQAFARDSEAVGNLSDLRAGFSTSPWRPLSFTSHYRHRLKQSEYDHVLDASSHGQGYPAFIRERDVTTDEVQGKLTAAVTSWLRTSFSYKHQVSDYDTITDPVSESLPGDVSPGGKLHSADWEADIYSLSATLTPWQRVYLSGAFVYQDTEMVSFDNGNTSVVPYSGDIFSILSSVTYNLSTNSTWQTTYSFSWSDYQQDNFAEGLPLGIHYQQHSLITSLSRSITQNLSTRLHYGFFYYDEPSHGGANDYQAHALFGTLVLKFP